LIEEHIFDEVIDGIEHQVISPRSFFSSLENFGIKPDRGKDYAIIERVLKLTTADMRWYMVSCLEKILETFGIREHKPRDTKFLKYSILKGRDCRILNRFIHI